MTPEKPHSDCFGEFRKDARVRCSLLHFPVWMETARLLSTSICL